LRCVHVSIYMCKHMDKHVRTRCAFGMHAVPRRALSAPYNTPLSNPAPRPSCPSGGGSRRQTSSSRAPECLKRKLLHHQRRPCDQVQRDTVRDHRRRNQVQQVRASLGAGAVLALESRRHTPISTVRARTPNIQHKTLTLYSTVALNKQHNPMRTLTCKVRA